MNTKANNKKYSPRVQSKDLQGATCPELCRGKRGGTTIIELVVYLAILTIITIVIVNGVLAMAGTFRRSRTEHKVSLAAETALERIVREIQLATDIAAISSSSLELKTFKDYANFTSQNAVNKKIYCSTPPQCVQMKLDPNTDGASTGDEQDLTPTSVTVSNLIFTQLSGAAHSKGVRIAITVSAGSGQYQITHTYFATAVLRGSY